MGVNAFFLVSCLFYIFFHFFNYFASWASLPALLLRTSNFSYKHTSPSPPPFFFFYLIAHNSFEYEKSGQGIRRGKKGWNTFAQIYKHSRRQTHVKGKKWKEKNQSKSPVREQGKTERRGTIQIKGWNCNSRSTLCAVVASYPLFFRVLLCSPVNQGVASPLLSWWPLLKFPPLPSPFFSPDVLPRVHGKLGGGDLPPPPRFRRSSLRRRRRQIPAGDGGSSSRSGCGGGSGADAAAASEGWGEGWMPNKRSLPPPPFLLFFSFSSSSTFSSSTLTVTLAFPSLLPALKEASCCSAAANELTAGD